MINLLYDNGSVSAKRLYSSLRLTLDEYEQWVNFYITGNPYFEEGTDYTIVKNGTGKYATDYQLTPITARKICRAIGTVKAQSLIKEFKDGSLSLEQRVVLLEEKVRLLMSGGDGPEKPEKAEKPEDSVPMSEKVAYDAVIEARDYPCAVTMIAKDYGLTAFKLNKILESLGIQEKRDGRWIVVEKYLDTGIVNKYIFKDAQKGTETLNIKWTRKGNEFIYFALKTKLKILPVCERQGE